MTEHLVTNRELSERLKKLGVPQNSYFAWAEVAQKEKDKLGRPIWKYEVIKNDFQAENEYVSAFLAGELGEILPEDLDETIIDEKIHGELTLTIWKYETNWIVSYVDEDQYPTLQQESNSMADAIGLMLEYLITNSLIKI